MSRLSPLEMVQALDALSRVQALSPAQSSALERALAKTQGSDGPSRAERRRWTPAELEAVRAAMKPGGYRGRPKRGEEVAAPLAAALGRTPEAIRQCMKHLRADGGNGARPRADEDQYMLELSEVIEIARASQGRPAPPRLRRHGEAIAA